jgi:hypothetical protein
MLSEGEDRCVLALFLFGAVSVRQIHRAELMSHERPTAN